MRHFIFVWIFVWTLVAAACSDSTVKKDAVPLVDSTVVDLAVQADVAQKVDVPQKPDVTLKPDSVQKPDMRFVPDCKDIPDTKPNPDVGKADSAGGCYGEGAKFTNTKPQGKCCGKLVPVVDSKPSGAPGGCLTPKCPCYVCTKCGDGLCGKGENGCNCPKDCIKPCFSLGGKFQSWGADLATRCCTGLSAIKDCMWNGKNCICPSCPCYLCAACGDKKCDSKYENPCNCKADCP